MSVHFNARCDLCEVDGPYIRLSGVGLALGSQEREDRFDPDKAKTKWDEFLTAHQWCGELRLLREGSR